MPRALFVTVVGCWLAGILAPPLTAQYTPPDCRGTPMYDDVPNSHRLCPWIELVARYDITEGCGPSIYCPDAPVTRGQAALLLGKSLNAHLWGQGRPGTKIHGDSSFTLCDDGDGPRYGLSLHLVEWADAAAACPAGSWVCAKDELSEELCDTDRPDDATDCDFRDCEGNCRESPANRHQGWLADAGTDVDVRPVAYEGDNSLGTTLYPSCSRYPVWCCRE